MEVEIKLLKNNDNREWKDIEWIEEFYQFLQGNEPEEIGTKNKIKLSPNKAFTIIWYLQEHFPLLPDTIEQCSFCKSLYDSSNSGYISGLNDKFYCNSCLPPFLDEKEEKIMERRQKSKSWKKKNLA